MKVRKSKNRRLRKLGFSLLELLAVVTILGIIAAVVIPRISVSSGTAKTNANAQNIAELNAAIERYYFDSGGYPSALTDLGASYLPDGVPNCPLDGQEYALDGDSRATTQAATP